MLRSTTMFAAVLLAIGYGPVPGANAATTSPATACKAIGLNPGEATFADCVRVLGVRTEPFRAVDDNTARARQSCALLGYAFDSEQFSSCVGNVMQTLFDRSGPQSGKLVRRSFGCYKTRIEGGLGRSHRTVDRL